MKKLSLIIITVVFGYASSMAQCQCNKEFQSQFRAKPSAGEIISLGGAALIGVSWSGLLTKRSLVYENGFLRPKTDTRLSVATGIAGAAMAMIGVCMDINSEGKKKKSWRNNLSASSEGIGLKLKF